MATRHSPLTLSDSGEAVQMGSNEHIKYKAIRLDLELSIDQVSISSDLNDKLRQASVSRKPGFTLAMTGLDELSFRSPMMIDSVSTQMTDRFSNWVDLELSFEAVYAPGFSQKTMSERVESVADEVSHAIPEGLPNRAYIVEIVRQAAKRGAQLVAESIGHG